MILVVLLFYVIFTVWLIRRLKDIKKNPRKYDIIPGFEKYKKSEWYWPTYKEYTQSDPPSFSGFAYVVPLTILMALSLGPFYYYQELSQLLFSSNESAVYFFVSKNGTFLAMGSLTVYSIALSDYWIMLSKRPIAICNNLHTIFRRDTRSTAWRKMTTIVLVLTIITCPLHLLCFASTGYADSAKIVYRPYLSVHERILYYSDVKSVERIYDDRGREKHCFLVDQGGESLDICNFGTAKASAEEIENMILLYLPLENENTT